MWFCKRQRIWIRIRMNGIWILHRVKDPTGSEVLSMANALLHIIGLFALLQGLGVSYVDSTYIMHFCHLLVCTLALRLSRCEMLITTCNLSFTLRALNKECASIGQLNYFVILANRITC
jgi:hypothetical protein